MDQSETRWKVRKLNQNPLNRLAFQRLQMEGGAAEGKQMYLLDLARPGLPGGPGPVQP